MNFKPYFPIIESFQSHTRKDWRQDILAGLTVAVMLVPQGMAYAMLAGIPPIYGLYGGLIPLFFYAILGTSRQMSIGPVAISALLVLAGLSQIAEPFSAEYISLVILTGLLVGIFQFILGIVKLGFFVNFISHPVIVGFTSAAAIIIAISQFKDLFGFPIPRFLHTYETAYYAIQHLDEINWHALIMCLGSMLIMLGLKKISRSIPGPLIVTIVCTLIVYLGGVDVIGVEIVKDVPKGLPSFSLPDFSIANVKILVPTVLAVLTIGIVESISIAKVIQSKHGDYTIRPDQELIALGLSKIAGSFFNALPTSGSFTRSAVNDEAGARSGFASIFTAIIIGLTLIFLTPLFYYLPRAVLASIILLSVFSLFDWKEAILLWKNHRPEFHMMWITFTTTLAFGIEEGVLVGVILSIAVVLVRSSKPHIAILGKLPNSNSYRNIDRFESARQNEEILILRFDDQLYFGNASYFLEAIQQLTAKQKSKIKLLVLDASSIHQIDSTGFHALSDAYKFLTKNGILFYISGMIGPVRDEAIHSKFIELIGEKTQFLNVHQAVYYFKDLSNDSKDDWSSEAIQSNTE